MNVEELIKAVKKHDARSLGRRLEPIIYPQLKDYCMELWHSAKKSQWINWQAYFPTDPDDDIYDYDENTPCESPDAENQLQQYAATLGKVNFIGDWHDISQHQINEFAKVTGDDQWIHIDIERAQRESSYKSTIAHGFLTLALIPKLTRATDSNASAFSGCKSVLNLGLNQVRFLSPVKSGSRVRATKKVINLTRVKRGFLVEEEIVIEVENKTRPACIANLLFRLVY